MASHQFPDRLTQEIRVTVALVCRELVLNKKSSGEKVEMQKLMIEKSVSW